MECLCHCEIFLVMYLPSRLAVTILTSTYSISIVLYDGLDQYKINVSLYRMTNWE